jgi:predicted dehydrogenase
MGKHRAAIVGCGRMGTEHGRAYAARPDVDLVAIADPDPGNLAAFGQRFGVPGRARYADYRDLLARERVDIVGVVTPVRATHGAVLAAVEAGVRGVFAEKPLAASLAEADEMVGACASAGVAFACGAIWRNHPDMQTAARLIRTENLIGRVLSVNVLGMADEVSGGGCHSLNVVRLLAGADADWVIGWMPDPFGEHDQGAGGYLHLANGVDVFVHMEAGPKKGVEVLGEWGVFFWDWSNVRLWRLPQPWDAGRGFADLEPVPFPYARLADPGIYPGISGGLQSLLDAVEHGGEPLTSGDDMRRVLEIAIALRESARGGRVPVALPIADRSLRIVPHPHRWLGAKPAAGSG